MPAITETTLRARAKRNGYRLCKSRRQIDPNNCGEYMLLEASSNTVALGGRFEAGLEDVAKFLDQVKRD
jgi:hypothetical protein